jgi:hypothetical protein
MGTIPSVLDAALEYASRGLPVFPCDPKTKKPLIANGFKAASTDEAEIRKQWSRWPDAMIGVPTGIISGMWVADVDKDTGKNIDGMVTLCQLIAQYGALPKTLMTITPRGGRHLIFSWANGIDIRNSAGKIGPGIDVRGTGGYVCLPPSKRADGAQYQWDPDSGATSLPAPDWLIKLAGKRHKNSWAQAALDQECQAVANAKSGTRNGALNTAAFNLFQLVAGGQLEEQEVRARLFAAAEACGLVADDGAQAAWNTIDSGARGGRAQPRSGPRQQRASAQAAPQAAPINATPCTIKETLDVFARWLILQDVTPVYAMLGAIAANLLPGDPVWLGIIGPPSSAKTEILNSTSGLPYVRQAATLSPAGLLSGTPAKQRAAGAAGGLLNEIGSFGILVLKDFGSILSMRSDPKAELLAALREIYDGHWIRRLGTDGGRVLWWNGKLGLLFASTNVIDTHHSVIGSMGDRFLLSRLVPEDKKQFERALRHVGTAMAQMRKELAEAVAGLFACCSGTQPQLISGDETEQINKIVRLVVRLRGAVERDRYSRVVDVVYGAEGTARIGMTLERLLAGLDTLGLDRALALEIVERVALDSVPPLRRRAYELLCQSRDVIGNFQSLSTTEIAEVLNLPTITVRRVLEDLAAYGLIARTSHGTGMADLWCAGTGNSLLFVP